MNNLIFELNLSAIEQRKTVEEASIKLKQDSTASQIIQYLMAHGPTSGTELKHIFKLKGSAGAYIQKHLEKKTVTCQKLSERNVIYSITADIDSVEYD
jgi:hypothetical protein